ncbi:MAG: tape measure protein [bacterium]|nr:tape measure protein [bacterium]
MATVRELITKWGFEINDAPLKRMDQNIKNIKSLAFKAGIAISAMGVATGLIVKEAAGFEQQEIAFETLLKSGEKAKTLLNDIKQFAKTTPFELTGLIESSKQLLAFGVGVNEIIPLMQDLGNISAGIGKDKLPTLIRSFGKIKTKGKATMEELNMMLEAGVPILDQLAENFGVNTEQLFKMITAGKVGFGDVQKALHSLSNGTGLFANLMEKQSKSTLGIWSNIKDVITQIKLAIGKDLLPDVKKELKTFLNFLSKNQQKIEKTGIRLFKLMFSYTKKVMNAFRSVVDVLYQIINVLGGLENAIQLIVKAVVALMAFQIIGFLGNLVGSIFVITKAVKGLSVSVKILKLLSTPTGIIAILAIVILLIQDIYSWIKGGESVLQKLFSVTWFFLEQLWQKIVGIFEKVKGLFAGTAEALKNVLSNSLGGLPKLLKIPFKLISKGADKLLANDFIKKGVDVSQNIMPSLTKNPTEILGVDNILPASTAVKNNNIKVNSPINITVPKGTNEEQAQNIKERIKEALRDTWLETEDAMSLQGV